MWSRLSPVNGPRSQSWQRSRSRKPGLTELLNINHRWCRASYSPTSRHLAASHCGLQTTTLKDSSPALSGGPINVCDKRERLNLGRKHRRNGFKVQGTA